MKKNILTLFVLFAFALSAQAQFTLQPVTSSNKGSSVQGPSGEFELVGYGFVKNIGNATKTYVWKMTRNGFPNDWTSAICDKNQCYDVVVFRAEFDLDAGDSGNIDVHLYPKNVGGSGSVTVEIFEKGDSANGKTQDFEFNAWTLNVNNVKQNHAKIYPNPVSKTLNIDLEATKTIEISVYNVLGQLKKTHLHTGSTSAMDVNDLAAGIYFLRYTTDAGKVISKQFKKIN
jgi:hypothetical protein